MWMYRLALTLGAPLQLHERVAITEETDPHVRRLVADRYFRRGCALRDRGRLAEALESLHRGSFVDAEHPDIPGAMGAALVQAGRDHEAIPWLERAVELDPAQAEWHQLLGQAFEQTGRPGTALRHYETALALAPHNTPLQERIQRLTEERRQHTALTRARPWWLAGSYGP